MGETELNCRLKRIQLFYILKNLKDSWSYINIGAITFCTRSLNIDLIKQTVCESISKQVQSSPLWPSNSVTNQITATASNQSDCKRNVDPTRPFLKGCFETGHMPYAICNAICTVVHSAAARVTSSTNVEISMALIQLGDIIFGGTPGIIDYLRSKNLLVCSKTCSRCTVAMVERTRADVKDGVSWWCPSCKGRKSIRDRNFFNKSHLTLQQWFLLIFLSLMKRV